MDAADSYVQGVCDALPRVKVCRIQHSSFDDRHARRLASALSENGNIKKLEFYKCPRLTSKGMAILAETISKTKNLTRLDLAAVSIGNEGLLAIATLLEDQSSCNLDWLSLEGVTCDGHERISLGSWSVLFGAALANPKLKYLDLTRNDLSRDHMVELGRHLRCNATLESLILTRNPIGDAGVEVLCEALGDNTSLTLLSLGDCDVSNRGLSSLAACLRNKNCHLERVYLYANPMISETNGENAKEEITYWLDVNSRGRKVLRAKQCNAQIVPYILAKVNNQLDQLYGLFHECHRHLCK
jgi:Ran GTPase-activating protein (RanGAP) involved in mRNA processing and transport